MPGMMDSAKRAKRTLRGDAIAVDLEYRTLVEFGLEIEEMGDPLRGEADQLFLPKLEAANTEPDLMDRLLLLRDIGRKAEDWINKKRLNP